MSVIDSGNVSSNRPSNSATTTATLTTIGASTKPSNATTTTLQLRSEPRKVVHFTEGTVDNEHMNKKKSKVCCIYQKVRGFDESSSESSGECEHHKHHDDRGDDGGDDDDRQNAYERDPSKKNRRRMQRNLEKSKPN